MDEMTTGDCFPMAFAVAEAEQAEHDEVYVVHGLPIGTGLENLGQRYWHAWVETVDHMPIPDNAPPTFKEHWPNGIAIESVIDRSNGHDMLLPKELFYISGKIERVWRYTLDEARERLLESEHYGPWVPGWKEMGL